MLNGYALAHKLRDLGDAVPSRRHEVWHARHGFKALAELFKFCVRQILEDPLTHIGQEMGEVGKVLLDDEASRGVVLSKSLNLCPKDRGINTVLLEDRILHVGWDQGAVEVPYEGDDRLCVEGSRHLVSLSLCRFGRKVRDARTLRSAHPRPHTTSPEGSAVRHVGQCVPHRAVRGPRAH